MRKILSGLLALGTALFFIGMTPPNAFAQTTITVPDDYSTIQLAIIAANPGDTVYVRAGTYYEHVTIGKSLTLQGEDRETTIIDGGGSGKVVSVSSTNYVTLIGFTITKGGSATDGDAGISLRYANHNLISDCIITSNELNGLYCYRSSYNTIQNCDFSYNEIQPGNWGGVQGTIHFRNSSHNTIADNNIYSNKNHYCMTVRSSSSFTTITGNHVYSNPSSGIHVGWSSGCNITNNNVHDNKGSGVSFDGASNNTVRDNLLCSNGLGIRTVYYSHRDTFIGNVIRENGTGIIIGDYGISSNSHIFYHNDIISNTKQVLIKVGGSNTWDNGYPDGGNYWSDYTGVDLDYDGIGDTPYVINASNRDRYPLMKPYNLIQVFLDIKPGSCPNPLNTRIKGVLTVAILGTEDFDPTGIDPVTVLLGQVCGDGVSPLRWSYEDVATPFEGEECDCHDLDGDGYLDLILKFDRQEALESLGEVIDGEVIKLAITGYLKKEAGGTPIEGSDCIIVLKKGK